MLIAVSPCRVRERGLYDHNTGQAKERFIDGLQLVFARRRDVVLEEALSAGRSAIAHRTELAAENYKLKDEAKALQKKLDEANAKLTTCQEEKRASQERLALREETCRRMEEEMGRVRRYIGDHAYDEASKLK